MTLDILLNYSPLIAFFAFIGMYSTQIYTTTKSKDVSGIAPTFYVFLTIALAPKLMAQVISFIKFGTWGLLLAELVNFIPAVIMMILVFRLRRKNDEDVADEILEVERSPYLDYINEKETIK